MVEVVAFAARVAATTLARGRRRVDAAFLLYGQH